MKKLCGKRSKQGFTLIELLVVVAITGILAAILFPVFARARESARRASCMSNLKQLGLATMLYTQDYDEKYPAVWGGWSVDTVWMGELQPYIKNTGVYFCASDTSIDDDSTASSNGATFTNRSVYWWVNHVSYGWNVSGLTQTDTSGNFLGISIAALDNASEIVMMADNGGKKVNSTAQYSIQCYSPLPPTEPEDTVTSPSRIHLGGGNFAFADGHVKWSKIPNPFLNNTFCNTPAKRKISWNY